jgi:hypothetical protein
MSDGTLELNMSGKPNILNIKCSNGTSQDKCGFCGNKIRKDEPFVSKFAILNLFCNDECYNKNEKKNKDDRIVVREKQFKKLMDYYLKNKNLKTPNYFDKFISSLKFLKFSIIQLIHKMR